MHIHYIHVRWQLHIIYIFAMTEINDKKCSSRNRQSGFLDCMVPYKRFEQTSNSMKCLLRYIRKIIATGYLCLVFRCMLADGKLDSFTFIFFLQWNVSLIDFKAEISTMLKNNLGTSRTITDGCVKQHDNIAEISYRSTPPVPTPTICVFLLLNLQRFYSTCTLDFLTSQVASVYLLFG